MSRAGVKERLGAFTAAAMAQNVDSESRNRWLNRLNRAVGWED